MHFYQQVGELAQIACLTAYLLKAWRAESSAVKAGFVWWIGILTVDVFVWQCSRPVWLQWGLNSIDFVIGWVVIYEKYRDAIQRGSVALVAAVVSLWR
jgi:hypothetical protein